MQWCFANPGAAAELGRHLQFNGTFAAIAIFRESFSPPMSARCDRYRQMQRDTTSGQFWQRITLETAVGCHWREII